jgi:hypothetical protein
MKLFTPTWCGGFQGAVHRDWLQQRFISGGGGFEKWHFRPNVTQILENRRKYLDRSVLDRIRGGGFQIAQVAWIPRSGTFDPNP